MPQSAESPVVRRERRGAVLVVTLDDAATRNAIGPDVNPAITRAIEAAGSDPQVAAIVIHGANGYFSAGGNVRTLSGTLAMTPAEQTEVTDRLKAMIEAVAGSPKPVIAAVDGGAAGIGFSLALACDLVVASENARFVAAQVRLGLTPDGGISHFLTAALPRQLAAEILLTGAPVEAGRLHALGLVSRLVAPGEALDAALDLADALAAGPPRATARIKGLIAAAETSSLSETLAREGETINAARRDPEAAEGIAAFLDKRPARFPIPRKDQA